MKVVHLVESLERGGLERVVVDLALAQKAAGHDVRVCCLYREGLLADELRVGGVPVTCAGKSAGFDLRAVRFLRSECAHARLGILHTHNAVANYYGALAALHRPICLINTRHGMGAVGGGRTEQLYRLSMRRTAAVACVCGAAREHFVGKKIVPLSKVRVVRNGIRVSAFHVGAGGSRVESRKRLGLDESQFVIGTVGRLNWAKQHLLLLDAFAVFYRERPGARLVIIGDGALRNEIQDRIEHLGMDEAVLMTGDRSDVGELLPAFDVFALTSSTEGYSIALLEAAAAGLPCVVTAVGGNAEIVQDGITGMIVPNASASAFAAAFESMATSLDRRQVMGVQARDWVSRQGSIEKMARSYEELYAMSCQEASRGLDA